MAHLTKLLSNCNSEPSAPTRTTTELAPPRVYFQDSSILWVPEDRTHVGDYNHFPHLIPESQPPCVSMFLKEFIARERDEHASNK